MDIKDKIMTVFWGRNLHTEQSWEQLADCITDIMLDHVQESVDYWTAETTYLQQRVEELEIDLMLEQEGFRLEDSHTIKPKRRTNFK